MATVSLLGAERDKRRSAKGTVPKSALVAAQNTSRSGGPSDATPLTTNALPRADASHHPMSHRTPVRPVELCAVRRGRDRRGHIVAGDLHRPPVRTPGDDQL